jgi:hypothetical protein
LIFFPRSACNAEPGGATAVVVVVVVVVTAAAAEDDEGDTSIESGDKEVVVDACGFSVFFIGSNFGFSRGINFSMIDRPFDNNLGAGAGVSSCV